MENVWEELKKIDAQAESIHARAVSALAEKPGTFFRSFLVVALAEALAIYGLIMGILLRLRL
jgi:F0F1-type ATP synthase membrane subunit c/vacuolar-type H+-ATPase subunit K